jgi:NAD(P)-dependent dehydrogenase (short-subunit alcohol dehydrogenase family)
MKTIFVTGITGLLGREFVNSYLNEGYSVIGIYRNADKFHSIFKDRKNLIGLQEDLMSDNAVDKIIMNLEKIEVFPHYLVNNATDGKYHKVQDDGYSARENLLNHFIINVAIPYELSFKLANHSKSVLEKIVNIASMYGVIPYNPILYKNPIIETPIQYSISKASLIHLTKELAIRFAEKNINVNSISFGGVDGRVDDEFKSNFAKITPLKRMLQPRETIGALRFLLSDESDYITGHNLIVDGGRTVW